MNVLIIDNGTRHLTELIQLFSGHKIKVVTREKLTDTNIQSDTLVVLSGAAPGNPGVLYSDGIYNTELEIIAVLLLASVLAWSLSHMRMICIFIVKNEGYAD